MKTDVRKIQSLIKSLIGQGFVPSRQAFLTILYVFAAQNFIQRISQGNFARNQLTVFDYQHRVRAFRGDVIFVLVLLFESSLQACGKEVRRVRTNFAAEKVERITEPKIDVLLNNFEWNTTQRSHVFVSVLFHQLRGPFDDAAQARIADEHVMRFLSQHELARARQRFKSRFSQGRQLILAIPIRKHRECKKVQPVIARLIESFEDARLVGIAAAAFEQSIRFVAAIASKITLQEINHRPKMSALFDVYLKQISQIVE